MNEFRILGPPGTGKTTYLAKQIENASEKHGSENVIVASYTRTAANVLNRRNLPIPRENIGTLHSLCYRGMKDYEIAEVNAAKFNEAYPEAAITVSGEGRMDEMVADAVYKTDGDKHLAEYNMCRAKLQSLDKLSKPTLHWIKKWESWKHDNHYIDFTDMIEMTIDHKEPYPGNPRIGIYDEVQDFNALEMKLVRHWAQFQDYIILAGDDDQCSVEGTEVLTTKGYVNIEDLDPNIHRLTSYYKEKSEVIGKSSRRKVANKYRALSEPGYGFKIKKDWYTGNVIGVMAGGKFSRTTLFHRWPFKWNENAKNKEVVYLMQKDNKFRIGRCRLIRSDGCFNFGVRCRMEHADKGWILRICESKKEASLWESVYANRYGIPQVLFQEPDNRFTKNKTFLDQEQINMFWNLISDVTLKERAKECLRIHNLLYQFPIITKERKNNIRGNNGSCICYTAACNLIPEVMSIASFSGKGKKVEWHPCKIGREYYQGYVYGLDVETHHHYFADGLLTHNCIFDFCGSSPEAFLNPPVDDAHKRILNQSWRLPRKIHEYSQRWIKQIKKREPKEFLPKNIDGEIFSSIATYKTPHKALDLAEKYISKGKTVMMLTSCGYLLEPLKKLLKSSGIPFHNPYRPSRGDWNPMGSFFHRRTGTVSTMERLLAFLNTDSYYWSGKDLSLWLELVRHKGVLTKYAKDRLQDMMGLNKGYIHMEEEFYEDIFDPFALERALNRDLVWFRDVLLASKRNAVEYPLAVYSKKGKAVLEEKPKLCIGTIHAVKGGEADVVILFPDLSLAAYQDYKMNPDSTIRTFYVGMTRARETLILCTPQSDLSMKLH